MPVYRMAHRPATVPEDIPYTGISQTLTHANPVREKLNFRASGTRYLERCDPPVRGEKNIDFVRVRALKRHPPILGLALRQRTPARHAKPPARADLLLGFSKSTYDLVSRWPAIEKRKVQPRLHAIRRNKLKKEQTSQHNPNRAIHRP